VAPDGVSGPASGLCVPDGSRYRIYEYGLGIALGRFKLDYATAPSHLTDRTYDVSLAIGFW